MKIFTFLNKICFKSLNFLSMGCQWYGYKFTTINGCSSLQKLGGKMVGRPAAKARGELRSTWAERAMPLTGFCGFLVLIEMEFRYERMIFSSYAQTKNFSGKVQWFYRTNEHIVNTLKTRVTYWGISYYMDLNLFLNMLTPIKKQGNEHIYILL